MINTVIFDFDGTLTDRKASAYKTYKQLFENEFPEKDQLEIEMFIQEALLFEANGTHSYTSDLLARKYGFDEEFKQRFKENYSSHIIGNIELRPGVCELLEILKKDYKLGILTNGSSKIQYGKIEKVGINKYFDVILASGEIGFKKPDKRAFEAICNKLGSKLEESLYIGDVFAGDIIGAIKAGLKAVWFTEENTVTGYDGIIIHKLSDLKEVLDKLNSKNC